MAHLRAIVDALYKSANAAESVVLATVVRISGSSYGGVGTRMVARVDGTTVGVVSGGCLETDLAEHAREVNTSRQPRVVTYDTRADDETAWGLGLGCNGLIDVLLEPLTPVEAGAVGRILEQALASKSPTPLATVIATGERDGSPSVGAHALLTGETIETTGNWGDRAVLAKANEISTAALDAGRRGLVQEIDGIVVAFEVIAPATRLVICGTGPDVAPVVRLGANLGWSLAVIDHRPAVPEHEDRFPAARLVECGEARALADVIALDGMTAAVVMSHHYARDLDYVRALISSDAAYIGVLGPRARSERMFNELAKDGVSLPDERVFAPIGMDVGGDGPEAIALSIVTEVSAVMSRRSGMHLRDRSAPLH